MPLDARLLELLVCPACKGALAYRPADPEALDCPSCRLRYPVRDGIPALIAGESVPLS